MTILHVLSRAERCRDLAEECRRVAAMYPSTDTATYYRQMAEHYSSLADSDDSSKPANGP
jgi:nitrogenase subunit NifH